MVNSRILALCLCSLLFCLWSAHAADVVSGSGFAITSDGHILTNAHVVAGCATVNVKGSNGATLSAQIVSTDALNDLAVLKVTTPLTTVLAFRDTPRIQLGETAVVLGYPLRGLIAASLNMTTGNISALSGIGDDARMVQFTAPIQPGNSGGPLLDASGTVMGIVTEKLSPLWAAQNLGDIPENVNFAVKASAIREFLESRGIAYRTGALQQPGPLTELPRMTGAAVVALECVRGTSAVRPPPAVSPAGTFPRVWKSALGTGQYEVRLDADFIYAERVFSGEQSGAGMFGKAEARKSGNLYVGKVRSGGRCVYSLGTKANSCVFEDQVEFTLITPTRIEGATMGYPAGAKFDCKKCQYSRSKQIQKFAWIPE